jgi:hypothetical protein
MRNGKLQKRKAPAAAAPAAAPASADPAAPTGAADTSEPSAAAREAKRRAGEPASKGGGRVAVELADGEPLLPNWHAAKDSDGRLYFYCTLTGEVSWHKPLVKPRR